MTHGKDNAAKRIVRKLGIAKAISIILNIFRKERK